MIVIRTGLVVRMTGRRAVVGSRYVAVVDQILIQRNRIFPKGILDSLINTSQRDVIPRGDLCARFELGSEYHLPVDFSQFSLH